MIFEKCYLIFDSRGVKKPEKKFNTVKYKKYQYEVYKDKGVVRRTVIWSDSSVEKANKDFQRQTKKINTLIYKISFIDDSFLEAVHTDNNNPNLTFENILTLDLKKGIASEIMETRLMGNRNSFEGKSQCNIKGSVNESSSYLDYWWAVILIIAITFFIFTQSGKRLKKIRRK